MNKRYFKALIFLFVAVSVTIILGSKSKTYTFYSQVDPIIPEAHAQVLPPTPPVATGKGSYYDYVLKTGWSSIGHRVCAARDWKRGTMLLVTNLDNGKQVQCKVTDFGPEKAVFPDRIVDLSSTSFSDIADLNRGVINVSVEPLP